MSPAVEALGSIKALYQPDDELLWEWWSLAELHYDEPTLLEGMGLVRQLSWATNSTERGRSGSSVVFRHHRASGVTMQNRSVLTPCRPLFATSYEENSWPEQRLGFAGCKQQTKQTWRESCFGRRALGDHSTRGHRSQARCPCEAQLSRGQER